jgi:flagellar basal-body rod modification protein FlgD
MAVDSTSSTTGAGGPASATASLEAKTKLDSKEFMTLMVAQMKNQDPMHPQDPSAFLAQLAQFSTVTGIQDMQNSLSTLSDSLRSSQVLSGSTLVGHEVIADADTATLGGSGDIRGAVTMPEGTSNAMLVVTDANGQLVRRVQLAGKQGDQTFTWDGTTDTGTRAAAGAYTISAIAQVGASTEQVATQLQGKVDSVTIDPTTNQLTLNTQMGSIALAKVRRVM